jgi:hypothetical protein
MLGRTDEIAKMIENFNQTSEETDDAKKQKAAKAFQLAEVMDQAEEPVDAVIAIYRAVIRLSVDPDQRARAILKNCLHLEKIIEYQTKNIKLPARYQGRLSTLSVDQLVNSLSAAYQQILDSKASDALLNVTIHQILESEVASDLLRNTARQLRLAIVERAARQEEQKTTPELAEKVQQSSPDAPRLTVAELAKLIVEAAQKAKKAYASVEPKEEQESLLSLGNEAERTKIKDLLAKIESFGRQSDYTKVLECVRDHFLNTFANNPKAKPIFDGLLLQQFQDEPTLKIYFQLDQYEGDKSYKHLNKELFSKADDVTYRLNVLLKHHGLVTGLLQFKPSFFFQPLKDSSPATTLSPEELKDALANVVFNAKEKYGKAINDSSWFHDLYLLQYSAYRKIYSFCYSLYHSDTTKTIEKSLDLNTKETIDEFNSEISSMYTHVMGKDTEPSQQQATEIASRMVVAFAERLLQQEYLSENSFGTYLINECLDTPALASYLGLKDIKKTTENYREQVREKIIEKGKSLLLTDSSLQNLPKNQR